jgi:cobalt-zinc-cadmium efflux system outer membrane protein
MRLRIAAVMACALNATPIQSQISPLSRAEAVQRALERGARLAVARADTALAGAALITAKAVPNPTVTGSYSKDTPNYHLLLDMPVGWPFRRSFDVASAKAGLQAADLRYQLARATVALDADTTYTKAIAAREHLALSRRSALDADSLLRMAQRRRDAGDASDMDVELARVSAGQQANSAAADSLTYVSAVLDLEAVLGMTADGVDVRPTDSLTEPPTAPVPTLTLNEAAANFSVESARLAIRHEQRAVFATPTISAGFDYHDPSQSGLLPTFGIGLTLPFFDRNRGGIATARAEQEKALAELTLARVEAKNDINHATRERTTAMARVARDRVLVTSANRVASMALTSYREGQSTLPSALEAERTAREVLAQYIDDLASAWIATAELRALATPVPSAYAAPQPPSGSKP